MGVCRVVIGARHGQTSVWEPGFKNTRRLASRKEARAAHHPPTIASHHGPRKSLAWSLKYWRKTSRNSFDQQYVRACQARA